MGVPETVALAAVALIGYLFGHRTRRTDVGTFTEQARDEMNRATSVARALEQIAESIRRDLALHHSSVARFKSRISQLRRHHGGESWNQICDAAEQVLSPTLQLATQIAHAYEEIRQQSTSLAAFTEGRTDPITGVGNRRALDEQLDLLFAVFTRCDRGFSLGVFQIDEFKELNREDGRFLGGKILENVAQLIGQSLREADFVARYGGDEFVVVLPQTAVTGACVFADRVRRLVASELAVTVSVGLAEAARGDTRPSLLSRADSALYSAKANGRNCVFHHTGTSIRQYQPESRHGASRSEEQLPDRPREKETPSDLEPVVG